jgi:hypothetical protein
MSYLDEVAKAIQALVPKDDMPDEEGTDHLFLLYALLARAKGEAATAEDVHDAWAVWMLARGQDHESIRPYQELDPSTRREDAPFLDAIHEVAREMPETRA